MHARSRGPARPRGLTRPPPLLSQRERDSNFSSFFFFKTSHTHRPPPFSKKTYTHRVPSQREKRKEFSFFQNTQNTATTQEKFNRQFIQLIYTYLHTRAHINVRKHHMPEQLIFFISLLLVLIPVTSYSSSQPL